MTLLFSGRGQAKLSSASATPKCRTFLLTSSPVRTGSLPGGRPSAFRISSREHARPPRQTSSLRHSQRRSQRTKGARTKRLRGKAAVATMTTWRSTMRRAKKMATTTKSVRLFDRVWRAVLLTQKNREPGSANSLKWGLRRRKYVTSWWHVSGTLRPR